MNNRNNMQTSAGMKMGIDRIPKMLYNTEVLRDLCDFETPRPFPVVRKGGFGGIWRGEKSPLFSYINYIKQSINYELYNLFKRRLPILP